MKASLLALFVIVFFCSISLGSKIHASSSHRARSQAEVVSYWTPERLAAARPMEVIKEGEPQNVEEIETNSRVSSSSPASGFIPGHPGSVLYPGEDLSGSESTLNHSKRSWNFNSGYAPEYQSFPWRAVGKIFFSRDGGDWVCSGAVAGRYFISTAGHCVRDPDTGSFSDNFVFVPGYNNGNAPFGYWSAVGYHYHYDWVTYSSACRDYAFAVLQKDYNGYGIGEVTGWFGYYYGLSTSVQWRTFGYPAAAPFNGELDYWTDSTLGTRDNCMGRCSGSNGCNPLSMGVGSSATGGCSGGPWIYNIQNIASSGINGVNSYKYGNQPNAIYGPYFDSEYSVIRSGADSQIP